MINDKKVIVSYKKGNSYAVDILIEKYNPLLYKLCTKLTKNQNDADDLFQDTWIKVFKNINSFDINKSFQTWMYTICINTYKDRYNKSKRWLNIIKDYFSNEEKEVEWERLADDSHEPDKSVIENEDHDLLRKKLNSLDDKYRIPLILFYFRESSYNEISTILNIPVGTVKSRLNTGRKILSQLLQEVELYGR